MFGRFMDFGRWSAGGVHLAAIVLLGALFLASGADAADKKGQKKKKAPPVAGSEYLVTASTSVRAAASSDAKVIDRLDKGSRVEVGPKTGAWFAVTTEEGKKGFILGESLLPLIDGTLETDLRGRTEAAGYKCEVQVIFDGKAVVEEEMFEISDYEILYDCKKGKAELPVTAYMFITEAPYKLDKTPHYQINVDLRGIGNETDEIFSTVFIYKRDAAEVVFDGLTMKAYTGKDPEKNRPAEGVAKALLGAAEMAPKAWGEKVWSELENPTTGPNPDTAR